MSTVLRICALIAFVLAIFGVTFTNMVALGLALWVGSTLVKE